MNYLEGAEKFYDLFGEKDDVDFYLSVAKKYGPKALELGVGTARLAINLAKAGIETWGIDTSQYMLNAADQKIKKLRAKVRNRLHLRKADVIDFQLPEKFNLIYFPSSSFDHIINPDDQQRALENIKLHLTPNGAYIFDLYLVSNLKQDKGWFIERKKKDDSKYVLRTGYQATDLEKKIMTLNMWYEVYKNGRMTERYHEGSKVYIHSAEGIRKLLNETGFRIVKEYGNHNGKPFQKKDNIIVIISEQA
jgi:ubiquinone/menaquinone biosynthesis C-methylase UbiE